MNDSNEWRPYAHQLPPPGFFAIDACDKINPSGGHAIASSSFPPQSGSGYSSSSIGLSSSSINGNINNGSGGSSFFSDIEYAEALDPGSFGSLIKSTASMGLRMYLRVFISQPFEVARLILEAEHIPKRKNKYLTSYSNKNSSTKRNNKAPVSKDILKIQSERLQNIRKNKLKRKSNLVPSPSEDPVLSYNYFKDSTSSNNNNNTNIRGGLISPQAQSSSIAGSANNDDEEGDDIINYFSAAVADPLASYRNDSSINSSSGINTGPLTPNLNTNLSQNSIAHSRTPSSSARSSPAPNADSDEKEYEYENENYEGYSSGYPDYMITPHMPYIRSALGALWTKDGPRGIWKATHISFVYSVLTNMIHTWIEAFLGALFNISIPLTAYDPTLSFASSATSSLLISPTSLPLSFSTVAISTTAAIASALLLAPIDLVRTRIILSPITDFPRSLARSLSILPSLSCPNKLLIPTILHAGLPRIFARAALPYIIIYKLNILSAVPRSLSHALLSFTSLLITSAEFMLKLPLETVLRRAQVAVLKAMYPPNIVTQSAIVDEFVKDEGKENVIESINDLDAKRQNDISTEVGNNFNSNTVMYQGFNGTSMDLNNSETTSQISQNNEDRGALSIGFRTVVPVEDEFKGEISTLWSILQTEDQGPSGWEGLWRGWRAGMLAICASWTLDLMDDQSQTRQEI